MRFHGVLYSEIPKIYSKFLNTGLLDICWRNNETLEFHSKTLIYVGVVPIVPCATCRQAQKIKRRTVNCELFYI